MPALLVDERHERRLIKAVLTLVLHNRDLELKHFRAALNIACELHRLDRDRSFRYSEQALLELRAMEVVSALLEEPEDGDD